MCPRLVVPGEALVHPLMRRLPGLALLICSRHLLSLRAVTRVGCSSRCLSVAQKTIHPKQPFSHSTHRGLHVVVSINTCGH